MGRPALKTIETQGDRMGHALVEVSAPDDWLAYHAIRRVELFENKGRFGIYDDRHPDDMASAAHPYLFKVDERPVGTTRLDLREGGIGIFRLVAISAAEQGRGYGRMMGEMVASRAREMGVRTLLVNAAPEAVGFYRKTGWTPFEWDRAELVGIAASCVQMRKALAAAQDGAGTGK